MSKFSKICFILTFIILLLLSISFVHATENFSVSDIAPISEETQNANDAASQITSSLDALSTSSVTKVSTVNSYEQANLQLNNILSIILISIGVLLILFAIAILIRLKK